MSSSAIITCKLKELEAEFNADCKKTAATANMRAAARNSKRGGHAKVYHSSSSSRPSRHGAVGARAGRPEAQGQRAGPICRRKGRHALEHRHQVSQRPVALAR